MPKTFIKDPNATLDYVIDWTDWLGSDTIKTVVWTVPSGLTKVSSSNTTKTATVWLSGGVLNTDYAVVATITTNANRIDDRTLRIRISDK